MCRPGITVVVVQSDKKTCKQISKKCFFGVFRQALSAVHLNEPLVNIGNQSEHCAIACKETNAYCITTLLNPIKSIHWSRLIVILRKTTKVIPIFMRRV